MSATLAAISGRWRRRCFVTAGADEGVRSVVFVASAIVS